MRHTGNSRSLPSQGGLSKGSTRDTSRNMYVSPPDKKLPPRRPGNGGIGDDYNNNNYYYYY